MYRPAIHIKIDFMRLLQLNNNTTVTVRCLERTEPLRCKIIVSHAALPKADPASFVTATWCKLDANMMGTRTGQAKKWRMGS